MDKKELIQLIEDCEDNLTLIKVENILKCGDEIDTSSNRWFGYPFSEDEIKLLHKLDEYESFFRDMIFQEGTASEMIDDNNIFMPEKLECFTYTWFMFKVEPLEDETYGIYDCQTRTITIDSDSLGEDSHFLHELIHLHEHFLDSLPDYYRDFLYWSLYKDLKEKIPRLDELIFSHGYVVTQSNLAASGGIHDILFLLKSFDLDIRMGYPLGTVFGYGRKEEFKDYEYIK